MQKIMVIEDKQDIRETIADIVCYSGYDCLTLADGIGAAAQARAYQPDLIICDILLPTVDGYTVIDELRCDEATTHIPFIFLSAKSTYEDIRTGMSLGADDYLTKPFTAEQLIAAIKKRLARFQELAQRQAAPDPYIQDFLKMTLPHELRTPMSGIIGYLSLLTEGFETFEPEQIKQMLAGMNVATRRLSHTVENYILYAQLTTSFADPTLAAKIREYSYCFGCDDIISQLALQKGLAYKRSDDVHLEVEPASIALSPESLEKVCTELIDNALKFSEPGQPIHIASRVIDDDAYEITICDLGRGMNEAQLGQLAAHRQFERRTFEQQGLGLGLAIAQKIVELANGTFNISSQPEQGTTVTFRLPLRLQPPEISEPEMALSYEL